MGRVAVTGAGGFIGGHVVRRLLTDGHEVVASDIKETEDWWQLHDDSVPLVLDLSDFMACQEAVEGCDTVINLAAAMGGMGMIQLQQLETGLNVLISTNVIQAASDLGAERYLYSSSACVYPEYRQDTSDIIPLKEEDAWPAQPQDQYGLEKLFSEELALRFHRQRGLSVRLPRFHAIYGPEGTFEGGSEKAPAALSRKVAEAVLSGNHEIDIWGDGEQTRSFCYIDDCVEGIVRLLDSDVVEPINLGSRALVTINGLVDMLEEIAGVTLKRTYNLEAPQGVRGRNSDNRMIKDRLGWEPQIPLRWGLERTYAWVWDQLVSR